MVNLDTFFERFLNKSSIFQDRQILQSNYMPETIQHRDKEIEKIASILAPVLRGEKASNIFIYGKTGTGKTVTVKYISKNLKEFAKSKNIPLEILYVNCKLKRVADTEYRLISNLIEQLGLKVPSTGLPTDEIYSIFFKLLEKKNKNVIIILDEIDQLVKKTGDDFIYNLTRADSELKGITITLVGISNDLTFIEDLDQRVKSSLSEEEIIFPPYNAMHLIDILSHRAKLAFKEGVVGDGVIEKIAAIAARNHGDARRAIDLLRIAGELAERRGDTKITLYHVDLAEEKIENDRVLDAVMNQPKQPLVVLYAALVLYEKRKDYIFTGEIYDFYKKICKEIRLRPLTQRRVSDILSEFDDLGLINARVISKGRYGRTREFSIDLSDTLKKKIKSYIEKEFSIKPTFLY